MENKYLEMRKEKMKEEALDSSFQKAETSRGLRPPRKKIKTDKKKSFPILALLLLIFAVLGLLLINNLPWAYVKYNTDDGEEIISIYKNFKTYGGDVEDIKSVFKSPYYIGLSSEDFTKSPDLAAYGFFSWIILSIILIAAWIFHRFRDISKTNLTIIHYVIATIGLLPCIFITLSSINFLGSHFLFVYNKIHIADSIVTLAFPMVFILIVFGVISVKIGFTMMQIDFNEIQKELEPTTPFKRKYTHPFFGDGLP